MLLLWLLLLQLLSLLLLLASLLLFLPPPPFGNVVAECSCLAFAVRCVFAHRHFDSYSFRAIAGTCGLVAMTSASHAEGRQFDPGQVYCFCTRVCKQESDKKVIVAGAHTTNTTRCLLPLASCVLLPVPLALGKHVVLRTCRFCQEPSLYFVTCSTERSRSGVFCVLGRIHIYPYSFRAIAGTCGLVAMTSAPHAEGRQVDPGQVYCFCTDA